jgi:hypothetical protein
MTLSGEEPEVVPTAVARTHDGLVSPHGSEPQLLLHRARRLPFLLNRKNRCVDLLQPGHFLVEIPMRKKGKKKIFKRITCSVLLSCMMHK